MKRRLLLSALTLGAGAAWAQSAGHLNVPGAQMVLSHFNPMPGTQAHIHQWLGLTRPDGSVEPMVPDHLMRQTLVLQDIVLMVFRPHGPTGSSDYGEIYLGDVDASNKARPVLDQTALAHYTMGGKDARLILRVPILSGRAYSGWRQPVLVHSGSAGIQINARAHGYLVAN
jgi:hypothetical protein